MKNIRKTALVSLLSILIIAAIGPFSVAFARRTVTITLDINNPAGGNVIQDPPVVYMCKDVTFEITPNTGYHIQQLYVGTPDNNPDFVPTYDTLYYTITKVKEDLTLHVVFAENAELILSNPNDPIPTLSVLASTSGLIPFGFDYLPGNFPEATPFFIEVTGTLTGTATIKIHYDDTGLELWEEEQLRLYVGNFVDFDGDFTVNGNDIAAINQMVGTTNTEFDVNGDGIVDAIDVAIVKEYANTGTVVSPGNLGEGDGEYRVGWIDITLYVDTEANIVWGETWHFSIFGCR